MSSPQNGGFYRRSSRLGILGILVAIAACSTSSDPVQDFGRRIVHAETEPQNWLTYGLNYQETRHSPLTQINDANVARLGLAWYYNLDTNRGQEATPLVVDGVIYTTSAWSKVQAFDGVTGKLLWQFDPAVPGEAAVRACCDVVNRGVAYWNGMVFVGTIDGRLIAIDAKGGKEVWSTMTVDPGSKNTITGAPRVVKGRVIIGNGGAEQGARGFVTAYDATSGKLAWRFYTVPGEPGKQDGAASDAILEKLATRTWAGKWWTQDGGLGGGTVWDAITYDPELNQLYIGVGNASFWDRKIRSNNEGDNLFLSSIVALNPDRGEYIWHYQQVPGDEWDYTATQQMILTDLTIGGKTRKVILQAPKNGYFYVIDRETGKLLSAKPYVQMNWSSGIDENGRPIINPEARWSTTRKPFLLYPNGGGGHNWEPMAFNSQTGLVYIPVRDFPSLYMADPDFKRLPLGANLALNPRATMPPPESEGASAEAAGPMAFLLAWDPVAQKAAWKVAQPGLPPGGVLSTAGNLIFQGDVDGFLTAYDARSGRILWRYDVGTPSVAPPVTWSAGGKQYVTLVVGWGGSMPLVMGKYALDRNGHVRPTTARVLTFSLDGAVKLPAREAPQTEAPAPPKTFGDAKTIARGEWIYHRTCLVCHGIGAVSGSAIPDLRRSPAASDPETWQAIVGDGLLKDNGMVGFRSNYSSAEIESIRAYVVSRANHDLVKAH